MKENIKNEILGALFLGLGGYIAYVLFVNIGEKNVIDDIGFIGKGLYSLIFLLFGILSYAVPFIFLAYSIIFFMNNKYKLNKVKLISFFSFTILLSAMVVVLNLDTDIGFGEMKTVLKEILRIGGSGESGGMTGSVLMFALYPLFGKKGSIIILAILMVLNLIIFANTALKKSLKICFYPIIKLKSKTADEFYEEKLEEIPKKTHEKKIRLKKKTKKTSDIESENTTKSNEAKESPKVIDFQLDKEKYKNKEDLVSDKKEKTKEKTEQALKNEDTGNPESTQEEINNIFESKEENLEKKKEMEYLIEQKIERLEEVLAEYGVEGKVVNYERGPVITRFELSVSKGVRVKKVVALQDDIAMNLEAKSIRIEAPIPGKNAVGIEIPNKLTEAVHFSNIIKSKNMKKEKAPLAIILGKNIVGENMAVDLSKMPHLLIAGRTGSGKSVCINTLISTIISRCSAEEVKFIMVDPKMVELMPFNEIPHLLVPVIIEPKQAAIALKWAVNEMENRYRLLAKLGVRNIESYNKLKGVEKLPYIVVVIDELADLMMVAPASIEESIARIAQKARAIGIHLVVATQRPSTDVVTGTIKANLPSRISFAVASQIDSRTILDTPGAEKLLGKGDMLYLESGSPNLIRIQGAYISDEEVVKLTEFLKKNGKPEYNNEIIEDNFDDDKDELYSDAIEVLKKEGKASISLIQRKLKVGYSRAARIFDQLQENGIVSEDRELLIDA